MPDIKNRFIPITIRVVVADKSMMEKISVSVELDAERFDTVWESFAPKMFERLKDLALRTLREEQRRIVFKGD